MADIFSLGDVVEFVDVMAYGDAAQLGVKYTVVNQVKQSGSWGTPGVGYNAITGQIDLFTVNRFPNDFKLVSRLNLEDVHKELAEIKTLVSTIRSSLTGAHAAIEDEAATRSKRDEEIAAALEELTEKFTQPLGYATGGIVGSGKIGLIGEAGTETVLPMVRGIGGNLTTLPGAYLDIEEGISKEMLDELQSAISEALLSDEVKAPVESGAIKSTGGSSSYYDIPLSDELMNKLFDRWEQGNAHIRTEELIREAFSNDFDYGTAFKSQVRAHAISHLGRGKAGNDVGYECNKIDWSINKIREKFA